MEAQLSDLPRTAFHIDLLRRAAGRHAVCELGGAGALFAPGCAATGMHVTLVDFLPGESAGFEPLYRELGVTLHPAPLLNCAVEFPANQFDAVVSFHAIRHLHAAPERFFLRLKTWLRPGGVFVLSVPNGARHDGREPRVADLRNLAKHMELRRVRVLGRNWDLQGTLLLRAADCFLRLHPPLCSDLYLIGYK